MLSASIGVAILALGLSLTIQKRILCSPANRRPRLRNQLKVSGYVFLASGGGLFGFGAGFPQLYDSYAPLGVMLLILGVSTIVQSQTLASPKAKLSDLGQKIRILSYVCIIGGVVIFSIFLTKLFLSVGLNAISEFLLN